MASFTTSAGSAHRSATWSFASAMPHGKKIASPAQE